MTRPDMYVMKGFSGQPINLNELQYSSDDLLEDNEKQIQTMVDAALQDYQHIKLSLTN